MVHHPCPFCIQTSTGPQQSGLCSTGTPHRVYYEDGRAFDTIDDDKPNACRWLDFDLVANGFQQQPEFDGEATIAWTPETQPV